MVVRILPYLDDLVSIPLTSAALVRLAAVADLDRDLLARVGAATAGSAFVAYGLRELLRAVGGGYYCCNHALYAALGLAVAAVGWVFLLAALRGPTRAAD